MSGGGTMGDQMEDLYQEIILDHYRSPRNQGTCCECGRRVHHNNPLCGDKITLEVSLEGERIKEIAFQGQGCSISMASASMMTELVKGKASAEALDDVEEVRKMMHGQAPARDLGDAESLEGVSKFPVRIKCALLPWMALKDALQAKEETS